MTHRPARQLLAPGLLVLVACHSAVGRPLPLTHVADVPLSGHATRWDYASFDPAHHRLYLAHLGDGVVTVFDTERNRVVADIPGIDGVHGVLVVPALRRVYATATGSNELVAIDADTLQVLARTPAGVYPDGLAYAPQVHKVYVSDEHGATETVVDTGTNRRVATIPVGGEVGNTQVDPVSGHVFVNDQGDAQLLEIDPQADRIVARIDLPGARGNHGLAIDPDRRRAYIACEDNGQLLVLDLVSRKVTAAFGVGSGPDVLAFDSSAGLLYVASESGIVSIFKVGDAGLVEMGRDVLAPDAHVVAVDPATHRTYFPLKAVGGSPVLRIMAPKGP